MIKTILLAEDDKTTATLVKTTLQKNGYQVLLASNGIEALGIVAKTKVDLIVTDVVMPLMDGVDLYEQLKKRTDTQNTPIIIITDKQIFQESFAALGVEHFIAKGTDTQALIDEIKKISNELDRTSFTKVLISGGNRKVLDQMQNLLLNKQCLVTQSDSSFDTVQKAFLMVPHIILLDLRLNDTAQTRELIHCFRSFQYLHQMHILTYAYLTTEEMEVATPIWQIVENDAKLCAELGAKQFIGNFSQGTFLDMIKQYLKTT